ncbi:MAG: sugar phosphate isomerase/epimerase family protein, partial [Thermoleophilia bacterium]|nr:sugar phosphate isomerase/epimerase family protein [Thermoleophilia bacterium]
MRLALSEISTVNASFGDDVAAYAAAGFDAIGIWEMKLPEDDEANRALLRDAGLAVANCVPAVPSILPLRLPGMEGPSEVEERIEALGASIRRLAGYEPESVLVLTGPIGDREPDGARRIVVDGLRTLAAAAREAGVPLGLEPIHPSQAAAVSFVNSIADALSLLAETGLDDVGVMVDTYNLWHEEPAAIAAVAERVTGVHAADAPPDPAVDGRLLPGEGGSRSVEIVRALRAAGWDGSLDVEIFST